MGGPQDRQGLRRLAEHDGGRVGREDSDVFERPTGVLVGDVPGGALARVVEAAGGGSVMHADQSALLLEGERREHDRIDEREDRRSRADPEAEHDHHGGREEWLLHQGPHRDVHFAQRVRRAGPEPTAVVAALGHVVDPPIRLQPPRVGLRPLKLDQATFGLAQRLQNSALRFGLFEPLVAKVIVELLEMIRELADHTIVEGPYRARCLDLFAHEGAPVTLCIVRRGLWPTGTFVTHARLRPPSPRSRRSCAIARAAARALGVPSPSTNSDSDGAPPPSRASDP